MAKKYKLSSDHNFLAHYVTTPTFTLNDARRAITPQGDCLKVRGKYIVDKDSGEIYAERA